MVTGHHCREFCVSKMVGFGNKKYQALETLAYELTAKTSELPEESIGLLFGEGGELIFGIYTSRRAYCCGV